MANSKGGVPMYNENPQYSVTIQSQLPQGSPAMYGTQVQKEIAGFGDAFGKLGSSLVDYAVKRQQQEDDNYIIRRENDMRKELNALLYDPVNGLANKKGHNAKGVTMTFDDEADKLTQLFMADVDNPAMQAKFQQRVSQWLPGYRKNIAVHEGNETFTARQADSKTNRQDKIDDAMRAPGARSAAVLYQSLQQNVYDLVDQLGISKEAAAEVVQGEYSGAVLQMAAALSGRGDTQGIMDLYKETKDKLSADAQSKLIGMVGNTQAQVNGVELAKKFLNDPKYKNPDGTINELALQALEKEAGPGATRTERVLVGGGSGSYFQDAELNGLIDSAANKYKVDPLLAAAVATVESHGNQDEVSSVGALGVMQLMPDTAAELGVDPNDRAQNVDGGVKYLKQMLDTFGGDVEKAVSAYNAGPGGDFNNSETREYRRKVMKEYERLKSQVGTSKPVDVDYAINKAWDDYEDKTVPLPEGTNGCAHAANYFAAYFNPWSKGQIEKGGRHMSYVPQLVKDAKESGAPGVEDFQEANLKKGDMIVYKAANDPEGMNHVVVYAGDGAGDYRFVGNSSRANNGQGGIVQGEDYRNMGSANNPLTPQYIIKTSPERTGGGAGHWEERTVSAYNEKEYNAAVNYMKEQIQFSKAEHDMVLQQALNDGLAKAKSLQTPSEVQALAESYGLNATDTTRLYRQFMSNRVDLANRDFLEAEEKRAQAKGREAFYAWWNANPNASANDISTAAADSNVGPEFLHSLNASLARAKQKGEKTWFQDDQCKAAFNNALAQFGNKGNQKTNAMLRLNQKEAELAAEGKSLTPAMIADEISDMNLKQTWYEGKKLRLGLPEADLEAADIDYLPGKSPNETHMNMQKDERGNYVEVDESTIEGWTP